MGKLTSLVVALVAVLVAVAGCAAMPGDEAASASTSTSTASTSTTSSATSTSTATGGGGGQGGEGGSGALGGAGSGGAAPECVTDADCGANTNGCNASLCQAGFCNHVMRQAGQVADEQIAGDCAVIVCDGAGGTMTMEHVVDAPTGAPECHSAACSPWLTLTPTPGALCSAGICTPEGACVEHIPVKCKTSKGSFVGCDGQTHPWQYIAITAADVECNALVEGEVGYCPPGAGCTVYPHQGPSLFGECE